MVVQPEEPVESAARWTEERGRGWARWERLAGAQLSERSSDEPLAVWRRRRDAWRRQGSVSANEEPLARS